MRAAWSSRSAPRCSSISKPAPSIARGSKACAPTSPTCAAPARTSSSSRRAPWRSAVASSTSKALQLEEKQAAAAAGQIVLAHAYQEILRGFGITTAQVLLTLDDSELRERYLNARKTLLTLLGLGAVPVINENDTVATQELRYGDNDRLSARVAQMVSAECLVCAVRTSTVSTRPTRAAIRTRALRRRGSRGHARRARAWRAARAPSHGSGGMRTKLEAARIAVGAGCRHVHRDGARRAADQRAARGRQGDVVPAERDTRRRAQAVDRGHLEAERAACASTRAPSARSAAAVACYRPASRPSTASSGAATTSASSRPTAASSRAA